MAHPSDDQQQTLTEHLSELRMRLFRAMIAYCVAVVVCFAFWRPLFAIVVRPLVTSMMGAAVKVQLVAVDPTEPVWVPMKLAMIAAIFVASPFIFWQLWRFFGPALYPEEKKYVLPFVVLASLGFAAGGYFGYAFLLPLMYPVLLGMASGNLSQISNIMGMPMNFQMGPEVTVAPMLTINNVYSFTVNTLLGCGLVFELPMVIALLAMVGLVNHRKLWKWNRLAVVLSFIVGGMLTPGPDIVSQLALGLPILALYNFSIIVAWVITWRREKRLARLEQEREQDEDDADDEDDDDDDDAPRATARRG